MVRAPPRLCPTVRPVSATSTSVTGSTSFSSSSANLVRISARSRRVSRGHGPESNAVRAASTAALMSSEAAAAADPISFSVAGSTTAMRSPEEPGRQVLLMNRSRSNTGEEGEGVLMTYLP